MSQALQRRGGGWICGVIVMSAACGLGSLDTSHASASSQHTQSMLYNLSKTDDAAGAPGPSSMMARVSSASEPSTPVWEEGATPRSAGDPEKLTEAAALVLAPANDGCGGALVIPDGPYPVLSPITTAADTATGSGDPTNSCSPSPVENGIWYTWTPATTGQYTLTTCAGTTATTDGDGVLAVFTSTGGCAGSFTQVAGACNDDACHYLGPSTVYGVTFLGGVTYYILASHYPTASGGGSPIQQYQIRIEPPPAPPNDTCFGAEVVPAAGPFPYLTVLVPDASGAASTGDPPGPSCGPIVHSLWYSFTPATSGTYLLSTCRDDHGGTGTTAEDTVVAIYTSGGGCGGPFTEIPTTGGFSDGCDRTSCFSDTNQSFVTTDLTAGTPYYVLVGSSTTAGRTAVQLRVAGPPVNDTCGAALPLSLDIPVVGTTAAAGDDYHTPVSTLCYSGVGQTVSAAGGRDVVYAFTAPAADRYSFRVADTAAPHVVYVGDCFNGDPPVAVSCLGAGNRSAGASAEEAMCLLLRAGQNVWVYVDETALAAGGRFTLVATRCPLESEPNGTPGAATPFVCGAEGSINPGGDADFFSLGTPPSGSRVFMVTDILAANQGVSSRVTDSSNTLQYSISSSVGGTPLPGTPSYLRVDSANATEPYRLYAVVRPPIGTASAESEPNNTFATANVVPSGYISGTVSSSQDFDFYRFTACQGDTILAVIDENPLRDSTPIGVTLGLWDSLGFPFALSGVTGLANSNTPGVGFAATTPFSPSEGHNLRASYSGTYYTGPLATGSVGDYLMSVTINCLTGSQNLADLSASTTDAPDPVNPGANISYTITVTNTGPVTAPEVAMSSATPPNTTFVSAAAPAGWACATPSVGGTGPITCTNASLPMGASAITIAVKVDLGTPSGTVITNTASAASTCRSDPNAANNSASTTTTVTTSALMPPAGEDCLSSRVTAHVTLFPPLHPGGCSETIVLQGPFKIWRSNPSDPGDGRDVILTVMACSRFSGFSAGDCGFGNVLAHPLPSAGTSGQVKSVVAQDPFPADSYFDVFPELETAVGPLHTNTPIRMSATVGTVPPQGGEIYSGPGAAVALYDAANVQVGTIEVTEHRVEDVIACPCSCAPSLMIAADKQTLSVGIPLGGSGVQYDVVKGTIDGGAPDWPGSFASSSCAAPDGGPTALDGTIPAAGILFWYVSRDGAFGQANGTYDECPAGSQSGDRDGGISACP